MSINRRKIGFYILQFSEYGADDGFLDMSEFNDILRYIRSLPDNERIYDLATKNKFHLLKEINISNNVIKGFFISAKYFHSPDLINKDDASERANPKLLEEGESELTHFAMKSRGNNIYLILEERRVGISIGQLTNYFDKYAGKFNQNKNYSVIYSIVPKQNFYEELRNLRRAYIVKVYANKSLLGDDYLGLTERTESVTHDIEINIKAQRGDDIKQVVLDWINTNSGITKEEINKIRVIGKNEEGNQVILDTEFMKRIEQVEVDVNEETGIVNSNEMLTALSNMLPIE